MTTLTISEKGQITLPAALRRKHRLLPHTQVQVTETDQGLVIKPVRDIMELAGIFADAAKGKSNDWDEIREYTERAVAEEAMRE